MDFNFLFWLFLAGTIVAVFQDLKRREVDNWLNLLLIIGGFGFVFLSAVFNGFGVVLFTVFSFIIMFFISNLFYYGRVFAGGDAKLLFAFSLFLAGLSVNETLINIGLFVLILMISGAVYSLAYSFALFFINIKKTGNIFYNYLKKKEFIYCFTGLIVLLILGIFYNILLIISLFGLLLLILFIFAKSVEKICMIKFISGKELREGDWIIEDVNVKGKTIKADWEGLSLEDIKLLRNKKKIKIKQGIPFVPGFLIAFILFIFKEQIINWILGMI